MPAGARAHHADIAHHGLRLSLPCQVPRGPHALPAQGQGRDLTGSLTRERGGLGPAGPHLVLGKHIGPCLDEQLGGLAEAMPRRLVQGRVPVLQSACGRKSTLSETWFVTR